MRKNIRKTVLVVLTAALLTLSATACNNNTPQQSSSGNGTSSVTESSGNTSGNTQNSQSTGSESSAPESSLIIVTSIEPDPSEIIANDEYYEWEGQMIYGLTDKGNQQKSLTIPKVASRFRIKTSNMLPLFKSAPNLETIIFENDDMELESGLFADCYSLKEMKLPENLEEIPDLCFMRCESLESLEIPKSVKKIGEAAFSSCISLKKLIIPEGVTSIDQYTFDDCISLEEIYIPESVTEISPLAFTTTEYYINEGYKLKVYVKKGSYADTHFDDYGDAIGHTDSISSYQYMVKEYY